MAMVVPGVAGLGSFRIIDKGGTGGAPGLVMGAEAAVGVGAGNGRQFPMVPGRLPADLSGLPNVEAIREEPVSQRETEIHESYQREVAAR